MDGSLKIGIAGLGYIGKRHLERFRSLGYVVFTADPKTDKAEALSLGSAGHYQTIEEMLDRETPDAVSVCLPTPLHRAGALAAFARGADVLMEKPFALTLEDIDAMLAAAKSTGRRIMVAHVCRFMAQYTMAKEIIGSRRLGKPVFLNAWRLNLTPGWSAQGWLGKREASGGTVMDLQIHDIDVAHWFLGSVRGAVLVQRQDAAHSGSGFFHAVSSLSFEGGAAAILEAGHLMPKGYPSTNGYRLVLEGGALEFGAVGGGASMRLYEDSHAADLTPLYRARSEGKDPYGEEIRHFTSCIESGEEFAVSAEDARSAVETVLKLQNKEILKPKENYHSI
jgi:UDP-N-acetylglucosamine 3-dehydrogenase